MLYKNVILFNKLKKLNIYVIYYLFDDEKECFKLFVNNNC